MLRRVKLLQLVGIGAFGLCTLAVNAAEPATKSTTPQQIAEWVRDLGDESYQRREAASAKLVAAGIASVDELAAGVTSENAETSWRALNALDGIAVAGDEAALTRVAQVLERLGKSGQPRFRKLATEIRGRQEAYRRDRAIASIRHFGGRLAGGYGYDPGAIALADGPVFGGVVPRVIMSTAEEPLLGIDVAGPPEPVPPPIEVTAPPATAVPSVVTAPEEAASTTPALTVADVGIHDALAPPPDLPAEAAPAVPIALPAEPAPAPVAVADRLEAAPLLLAAQNGELSAALTIDHRWRGGDEGLQSLEHLPEISSITLEDAPLTDRSLSYIAALPKLTALHVRGVSFTSAGLRKFRQQRPRATVFALGDAMLGINADVHGRPCVLSSVFYNSGAYEAGLKQGDKLTSIDGDDVRDFSDVTIAVYRRQPGEKLRIEFQRAGKPQVAEVVLKARNALERAAK